MNIFEQIHEKLSKLFFESAEARYPNPSDSQRLDCKVEALKIAFDWLLDELSRRDAEAFRHVQSISMRSEEQAERARMLYGDGAIPDQPCEEFEKWYKGEFPEWRKNGYLDRDDRGDYLLAAAFDKWAGWQAAWKLQSDQLDAAKKRIAELEAEQCEFAAEFCEHVQHDEHGNKVCRKDKPKTGDLCECMKKLVKRKIVEFLYTERYGKTYVYSVHAGEGRVGQETLMSCPICGMSL